MPYHLPKGVALWAATKLAGVAFFLAGQHWLGSAFYFSFDPWFLWQILIPASRGFGAVVQRFQSERREVWLTIDDGPDPLTTPRVLALLDEYGARATFFVIGANVRRNPELVVEIARRGHTLANHTQNHPSATFWAAGPARLRREIDGCDAALREAGVAPTPYFRAPVGIKTVLLHPALAERGMQCIAWSARGYDSLVDEAAATQRILGRLAPGAIVLLHEGRAELSRVAVIERVLRGMKESGFAAVLPDPSRFIAQAPTV